MNLIINVSVQRTNLGLLPLEQRLEVLEVLTLSFVSSLGSISRFFRNPFFRVQATFRYELCIAC